MKTKIMGLVVAVLVLAADQWSKALLIQILINRPPLMVLPVFNLVMVWNTGISFGMFAALHETMVLTVISLIITGVMLVWLWRNDSKLVAAAIGSIIGGALGNVIDRLRFGAVSDFFDFHVGIYHWPAFNIADSAIFIGVVVLCAHSMFSARQEFKGNNP